MDAKLIVLFLALVSYSSAAGALRRTPKVYNALITTDDNLTPSRAFPVIQPTIHETGIATYPFGPFNPYRFYNPPLLRVGPSIPQFQPFPQQFVPQQSGPIDLPPPQNEIPPTGPPTGPQAGAPPPMPQQAPQPLNPADFVGTGKADQSPSPIPLNEFGLPPSLIPLNAYQPQQQANPAVYLPPYPYPSYPLANEGYNPYQEQYLPPYGYFPGHSFGLQPEAPPRRRPFNPNQRPVAPPAQKLEQPSADDDSEQPQEVQPSANLDGSIINGIENKNTQVPDVPPPPIPTGAKAKSKA